MAQIPDTALIHEILSYAVPGAVMIFIGTPLAIAIARRIARGGGKPSVDPRALAAIDDRLARIEQAVDSIAVEVERVSESQRYNARLQAEQTSRASLRGPTS